MKADSRVTRWLHHHAEASFRTPWRFLVVFTILGALALAMASRLEFRGDFIELLPEQTAEVRDLRLVEKKAGGGGYLIVIVKGGDQSQRRRFAADFAAKAEKETDVVSYIDYHFDISFFKNRALLVMPTDRLLHLESDLKKRIAYEKKIANPLYVDLEEVEPPQGFSELEKKYSADAPQSEFLESKDGSELFLYIKPTQLAGDLNFNRKLLARVTRVAREVEPGYRSIQTALTGAYAIRVEEDEVMQADLARGAVLAALVSMGIILLASRRIVALVIVAVPVAIGIAATFAFAFVTIGHLNPVTGFLGAILIGLGIEYGVHLSMRYWEERQAHDALVAMKEALVGTFEGALTSAATNAAVFFVLVFAEFEAFKQFGLIASFGVLATVAAAYLIGPSILFLAEVVRPFKRRVDDTHGSGRLAGRGARFPLIGLLASMIAVAAYSLSVSDQVGFETNLRNLKGESPATELDDHVHEQLGIIMVPALAYVKTLDEARKVAAIASDVQRAQAPHESIAKVASLNDFVPWDAEERVQTIARIKQSINELPNAVRHGEKKAQIDDFLRMTEAAPWLPEEVPLEIRRRFTALGSDGYFVLIFPKNSGYDVGNLTRWAADLATVAEKSAASGIDIHMLDGNWIAAKIFGLIKHDGPRIMALAAIVVFAMIWLSLKRFSDACLVAGPLYIGMICILGAMHVFDVRLNFLNVVVLPNLLAIAVDNSVHLFHRYKEEGVGSLGHIMRHTGFAAIVATLSNAAGYGAMLIARHEGLRSVGVMALIGVACTFMGTTVFFPALLAVIERRKSLQVSTS